MLFLKNIKKSYANTEVLRSISLHVREGEFVSLLGASGCGKTTLLRIIAGLEQPDEGQVVLGNREVTGWDPARRNIAMVFQSYALYPHKTVRENIAFPLRMRAPAITRLPFLGGLTAQGKQLKARLAQKIPAVADILNISQLLERKPAQLSGGQKQRVALARALVREPSLFLMDEPLSNLDAKLRNEMRREIIDLHRHTGKTFVYVTHDQVEAMTMSDRIVLMHQGEIQQIGTPLELYDDPVNLFTASFIGSPSLAVLPCRVDGKGMRLGTATMESETARHLSVALGSGLWQVGLRAEACVFCAQSDPDALPVLVRMIEHMGNERLAHLDATLPGGKTTPICVRLAKDGPVYGPNLFVKPDWDAAFIFTAGGERVRPLLPHQAFSPARGVAV